MRRCRRSAGRPAALTLLRITKSLSLAVQTFLYAYLQTSAMEHFKDVVLCAAPNGRRTSGVAFLIHVLTATSVLRLSSGILRMISFGR